MIRRHLIFLSANSISRFNHRQRQSERGISMAVQYLENKSLTSLGVISDDTQRFEKSMQATMVELYDTLFCRSIHHTQNSLGLNIKLEIALRNGRSWLFVWSSESSKLYILLETKECFAFHGFLNTDQLDTAKVCTDTIISEDSFDQVTPIRYRTLEGEFRIS